MPPLGRVRQRIVGHFGHTALVTVGCSTREGKFDEFQSEFQAIHNSFAFDKDAAYQGGVFSGPVRNILIFAIIGGVVGAVYYLAKNRKQAQPARPTYPSYR